MTAYRPNTEVPLSTPTEYLAGMNHNADLIDALGGYLPHSKNLTSGLASFRSTEKPNLHVVGDSISANTISDIAPCGVDLEGDISYVSKLADPIYVNNGSAYVNSRSFAREAEETAGWLVESVGINLERCKSSTTQYLSFDHFGNADKWFDTSSVTVYYSTELDGGEFDVIWRDYSAVEHVLATVSCLGASDNNKKIVLTDVTPSGTFRIQPKTTDPVYVYGWESSSNSNKDRQRLYGSSTSGRRLTQYGDSDIEDTIDAYPSDAVIMALGTNDYVGLVPSATFKTKVEHFVDYAKSKGKDVLLLVQCGSDQTATGGSLESLFLEYKTALYDVATTRDVALFDVDSYFGGWDGMVSKGYNRDNYVHPNDEGSVAIANALSGIFYARGLSFLYPDHGSDSRGALISPSRDRLENKVLGDIEYYGKRLDGGTAFGNVTAVVATATVQRIASPLKGQSQIDTSLGKPIWWDGSNWIDATGATV